MATVYLRTLYFVQADEIRSVTFSVSDGALVPDPMRRGIVRLQRGDEVWGLDESTRRFLAFRSGLTGFPASELQVVANWRRTVLDALSDSGR